MSRNCIPILVVFALTAIANAQQAPESDPKELTDLRSSWTRARNQATEPIDRKYVESLLVMKDRFTKSGNLEAALAVQAEIQLLSPAGLESRKENSAKIRPNSLSDFANHSEFFAWLKTVRWLAESGATLQFLERGELTITKPSGEVTRYAITLDEIGKLSWKWSDGRTEVFLIERNLKSATAKSWGKLKGSID
ncbi:MAG: hypothetical protein KDM63_05780 [Verrucomicrobiae bacterium]|nr:hypothetical protein [Verrucomicrobiae bacterium]MCB1092257.1 hypothetical protein [Verrucomicrobiae bacterium]